MIRGGSLVTKDIPPFIVAVKDPVYFSGINTIGLKRRGFSGQDIDQIQEVYNALFNKGMNTSQSLEYIDKHLPDSIFRRDIVDFIRASKRGILKGSKSVDSEAVRVSLREAS